MSVSHANDHLFKKMLGKSMEQVSKELGFPTVPQAVFKAEDIMILQQHIDQLPTSHQAASAQLVRALQKGTVMGIHTLEDGKSQVAGDFTYANYRCTLVLVHWREQWETQGVPSVMPRKKKMTFPLTVAGLLTVFVVAGLALWNGGVIGNGNNLAAMSLEEAKQAVEEEGYFVLTPEQKNDIVAEAEQQGYEKAQQEREALSEQQTEKEQSSDQTTEDEAETEEIRELTFTMREGMTAQDLTEALKQFGLIDNETAFGDKLQKSGIAQKVRPGTYTFTSDMSESEIMEELE